MGQGKVYDFNERLDFSKGVSKDNDLETIKSMLLGCVDIHESTVEMDKIGVDYIAKLRGNAEVFIDAKTRSKGCSRYWKGGHEKEPELAIEKWSVLPEDGNKGKTGWTLDEGKITDMVLYTFDKSDSSNAYLVSFQTLRMAAAKNIKSWCQRHKVDVQDSGAWKSEAVFVPVSVVFKAMQNVQKLEVSK